jgi:Tfp pilus assembly protein PilP
MAAGTPLLAQNPIAVGSRVGSASATGSASASGYNDLGRRDPFVSLVTPKKIPGATVQGKPGSLSALAVADVLVTGIMKVGQDPIALLQGPDGKSFPTKSGDRLRDGVVKRIERDAVVFLQQEEDVMGAVHPKETRKTIRLEGAGR